MPVLGQAREWDALRRRDLIALGEDRGGRTLSLFLPLSRNASQGGEARIRAKHLLRHAERALLSRGAGPAEVDTLVGSARAALDDPWPSGGQAPGLALFADQCGARRFKVPIRLPELAVLGYSFAVGPLLPLVAAAGPFYVLAVSREEIGVFRGTRFGMEALDLAGSELATWLTLPRAGSPRPPAFLVDRGETGGQSVHHAVAGEPDHRVVEHLREVDRTMRDIVDERAPMVLAGPAQMQALYREVNTYPHLLSHGIERGPHDLDTAALHRAAWALVEPALRSDEAGAISRYAALKGTGRTSEDLATALAAAERGQVDLLLVAAEDLVGRSAATGEVLVRPPHSADHGEQLELLVIAALRRAAPVFIVPAARMPTRSPVAVVLRG